MRDAETGQVRLHQHPGATKPEVLEAPQVAAFTYPPPPIAVEITTSGPLLCVDAANGLFVYHALRFQHDEDRVVALHLAWLGMN